MTTSKRQLNKQLNQQALINATLDCIAEIGITQTSVSEIIQRADLSRGIIHLHFGSKDKLLIAAGEHASNEYYSNLENLLKPIPDSPQFIIDTVIRSDLSPQVLTQRNVNIWYAFRGEARYKTDIAAFSDTRDQRLRNIVRQAYEALCGKDQDPALAKQATYGTLALMEGMWTDYLLHADSFDRKEAINIVMRFQAALFPQHFDLDGAMQ